MPETDLLLAKFFSDFNVLKSEGILIGDNNVSVNLNGFICDAPVRSALKKIISSVDGTYDYLEGFTEKSGFSC